MRKDIYSRVKYPKGQRSVGQVRMGTDVRGIGVKRESTHVAIINSEEFVKGLEIL